MPAPEIIHNLVKRFEENRDAYRSGKYKAREIDPTDREIDRLVYELYGLTEDENKDCNGRNARVLASCTISIIEVEMENRSENV
ncbi:MAG: hypothetical protein C0391_05605 [Anaerolinea sp.]|nr:hypothetical protein [Anaerolinea sp.]